MSVNRCTHKRLTHEISAAPCHQFCVVLLASLLLLVSCAENPEIVANNDPEKYSLAEDVLWASPDGFDLTMDIYTPTSDQDLYPVIVMFHGGGWLINDKSIMDQAAAYLATNSNYVVCNVDYRLLSDNGNTVKLNEIVNDAFGALLWVKTNIETYHGDKARITVTGDSAGAHLSAVIVNMGDRLSSDAFSETSPRFTPTYLPPGSTAEEVADNHGLAVQAAILSYGAFNLSEFAANDFETMKNPFWLFSGSIPRGVFGEAYSVADNPLLYEALSPISHIPKNTDRELPPQLLTVGSEDPVTTPTAVKAYYELLKAAGHPAKFWQYEGKSHAFLDSGSNPVLGSSFEADAPLALDVMIEFLDETFYQPGASSPSGI